MVSDGVYTATVDRIEEGTAVVLVEGGQERGGGVVDQLDLPVDRLPDRAQTEGAVLEIELDGGELRRATYEPETTEERVERLRDRFDRLSERPEESDGG